MEHSEENNQQAGTHTTSRIDQLLNSISTRKDDRQKLDFERAAKVLGFPGIGRNKLFQMCRDAGYLTLGNMPYQPYVNAGYFVVELVSSGDVDNPVYYPKTYITLEGLAEIEPVVRKYVEDHSEST